MKPDMIPVESSAFSHYGHDEQAGEIHFSFHSGGRHAYPITPEKFQEFLKSDSKGKWFHKNIDKARGRKVSEQS